mmetsp:Transcript_23840/g.34699  ORF Transcript_23840/g.34699 Transcript_23840/m.34699 type:complete len:80 (-) Transcript_23840:22-261(-)
MIHVAIQRNRRVTSLTASQPKADTVNHPKTVLGNKIQNGMRWPFEQTQQQAYATTEPSSSSTSPSSFVSSFAFPLRHVI